jgi:hypothetical protein
MQLSLEYKTEELIYLFDKKYFLPDFVFVDELLLFRLKIKFFFFALFLYVLSETQNSADVESKRKQIEIKESLFGIFLFRSSSFFSFLLGLFVFQHRL